MTEKSRHARLSARKALRRWMDHRYLRHRIKRYGCEAICWEDGRVRTIPGYQPYPHTDKLLSGEIGTLEGIRLINE